MKITSCCLFQLLDKWYGVDARRVREVVRLPEITPVEEAPSWWIGVMDRRGQAVAVMDLHRRMGRQPSPYQLSDMVLILEDRQQRLFGLVASRVEEIYQLPPDHQAAIPAYTSTGSGSAGLSRYCIIAMLTLADRVVMLLDPDHVAGYLPEAIPDTDRHYHDIATADDLLPPVFEQQRYFMPDLPAAERLILRQRAQRLAQVETLLHRAQHNLYSTTVVVQLHQELLAINLRHICGFTRLRTIFAIPCCPAYIVGQINLRGEIITLADIGTILGIRATEEVYSYALLIKIHEQRIGIPVHDLLDMLALTEKDITMNDEGAPSGLNRAWLQGATWYRDQLVPLLDLERLCHSTLMLVDETLQESL
ncbi:MAG: chemotaxis protein CheW [Magnetococcales bacterium]|nr:chemotaxis protein CheW [Magnetococcales bacterium]